MHGIVFSYRYYAALGQTTSITRIFKQHREGEESIGRDGYLCDGVLSWSVDHVVERPLPAHVVDADELKQGGVNKAHTHAVPHVHGCQIRHDRQR